MYRLVIVLAAGFLFSTAAHAQDSAVAEAYAQYSQALAEQDYDAADAAAARAYSLSEDSAGASVQTAVLAYNLAWLRALQADLSKAVEPARRARELAAAYPDAAVEPANAALILDMALGVEKGEYEPLRNSLQKAASVEGADANLLYLGYTQLAAHDLSAQNYSEAAELARLGLEAGGDALAKEAKADLILLRGGALVMDHKPIEAAQILRQGGDLLGPQEAGNWDTRAIQLRAWTAVTRAMLYTFRKRLHLSEDELEKLTDVFNAEIRPLECLQSNVDIELGGEDISYPKALERRGGFGAAILEYDIAPDGQVVNPEIVYSVPGQAYEESVMEAVSTWYVEEGMPPEACRNDRLVDLTYVIGNVRALKTGSRIPLGVDD